MSPPTFVPLALTSAGLFFVCVCVLRYYLYKVKNMISKTSFRMSLRKEKGYKVLQNSKKFTYQY